jgi:hypothetical protein
MATSYNRAGDGFYHSAYVKSKYFDNFIYSSSTVHEQAQIFEE